MRIVKFSAENVKKLKVVEIKPDGSLVEITGPNGSGKSSVLDAIFYALKGAADIPSQVVRKGTESATVKLDLGGLLVTRHFKSDGSTRLTVEATSGARFPSPQAMLDELIGALSFDPLAFTRMKPAEQLNALRTVIKVDVSGIDVAIQTDANRRSHFARELKQAEAQLATAPGFPDDTPDEAPDLNAIIKQLDEAGTSNTLRESELNRRKLLEDKERSTRQQADELTGAMGRINEEAEEKIRAIRKQTDQKVVLFLHDQKKLYEQADDLQERLSILDPLPERIDTRELIAQSNEAQVVATAVSRKKHKAKLQENVDSYKLTVSVCDENLKMLREKKVKVISEAKMPVDNLSFNDNEVLYDELPLVNASSAEQLRVSVALAMAANPKLRIIRVKDGSLLDANGLKLLGELAELNDFQVWVERVEDAGGRPCVVMEDGSVRA